MLGMRHCPASKIFLGLEERSRHFPSRLGPHMSPRPGAAEGTIAMVGVPLRLGCWLHHGATSTRMPSPPLMTLLCELEKDTPSGQSWPHSAWISVPHLLRRPPLHGADLTWCPSRPAKQKLERQPFRLTPWRTKGDGWLAQQVGEALMPLS